MLMYYIWITKKLFNLLVIMEKKFSCKLLNNQRRQPNLITERKQSNSFGRFKIGKIIYTRGSKDGYKIFTYDETNFMYNYIGHKFQDIEQK
jgi:hypothetical protein